MILRTKVISKGDTFTNPIRATDGSEPYIVYAGGYYYLVTISSTDVELSRATTLEGLKSSTKRVARNPQDEITYHNQLTTNWSIDGTVLRFNDWGSYLVFSCFNGGSLQSLCIAPLESPTSIGSTSIISTPASAWEDHDGSVNEVTATLYYGDEIYLTFSASSSWPNYYSLGILTWERRGSVLSIADRNYGPGNNGSHRFFTSPNGSQIWTVFHADANPAGACDSTRYTMDAQFYATCYTDCFYWPR
ncbi:glycoside hydrolase family 43 protein [Oidiodendron maius Zn]|uniref:Glycoside hydrolase family 43 protein n=1 Tax=Oidiodendron maius (strain Zn) TaxID=913774 RepID=A0A0C3CUN0_OIDMZ|nr:glycoside hydrolase family 43 protein [Oidiodendron maius Zn]